MGVGTRSRGKSSTRGTKGRTHGHATRSAMAEEAQLNTVADGGFNHATPPETQAGGASDEFLLAAEGTAHSGASGPGDRHGKHTKDADGHFGSSDGPPTKRARQVTPAGSANVAGALNGPAGASPPAPSSSDVPAHPSGLLVSGQVLQIVGSDGSTQEFVVPQGQLVETESGHQLVLQSGEGTQVLPLPGPPTLPGASAAGEGGGVTSGASNNDVDVQKRVAEALAALPPGATLVAVPLPSGDVALYPVMPGASPSPGKEEGGAAVAEGETEPPPSFAVVDARGVPADGNPVAGTGPGLASTGAASVGPSVAAGMDEGGAGAAKGGPGQLGALETGARAGTGGATEGLGGEGPGEVNEKARDRGAVDGTAGSAVAPAQEAGENGAGAERSQAQGGKEPGGALGAPVPVLSATAVAGPTGTAPQTTPAQAAAVATTAAPASAPAEPVPLPPPAVALPPAHAAFGASVPPHVNPAHAFHPALGLHMARAPWMPGAVFPYGGMPAAALAGGMPGMFPWMAASAAGVIGGAARPGGPLAAYGVGAMGGMGAMGFPGMGMGTMHGAGMTGTALRGSVGGPGEGSSKQATAGASAASGKGAVGSAGAASAGRGAVVAAEGGAGAASPAAVGRAAGAGAAREKGAGEADGAGDGGGAVGPSGSDTEEGEEEVVGEEGDGEDGEREGQSSKASPADAGLRPFPYRDAEGQVDDAASGGPGSSDFRREKRAQGYARLNIPILLAESGLTAKSLRQQHNGVFEKELFPGKLRGRGLRLTHPRSVVIREVLAETIEGIADETLMRYGLPELIHIRQLVDFGVGDNGERVMKKLFPQGKGGTTGYRLSPNLKQLLHDFGRQWPGQWVSETLRALILHNYDQKKGVYKFAAKRPEKPGQKPRAETRVARSVAPPPGVFHHPVQLPDGRVAMMPFPMAMASHSMAAPALSPFLAQPALHASRFLAMPMHQAVNPAFLHPPHPPALTGATPVSMAPTPAAPVAPQPPTAKTTPLPPGITAQAATATQGQGALAAAPGLASAGAPAQPAAMPQAAASQPAAALASAPAAPAHVIASAPSAPSTSAAPAQASPAVQPATAVQAAVMVAAEPPLPAAAQAPPAAPARPPPAKPQKLSLGFLQTLDIPTLEHALAWADAATREAHATGVFPGTFSASPWAVVVPTEHVEAEGGDTEGRPLGGGGVPLTGIPVAGVAAPGAGSGVANGVSIQVHHNVASRSVTISAVSCTGAAVVLDPAILDFVKAQVLAQLGAEGVESVDVVPPTVVVGSSDDAKATAGGDSVDMRGGDSMAGVGHS